MLLLALLIAQNPAPNDSLFRYDASAPLHARDTLLRITASGVTWVGRISPRPLLMQFGEFEASMPMASMQRYAAAAKEPVTVLWYPTGHELNDPKAWADRTTWARKQLGLK